MSRAVADPDRALPSLGPLRELDADAWEELYREARPVLWRFARSRLATDEQAEDAVSETFVRAMSAIDRFTEGTANIVGWLCGIERNVVNEIYRVGQRDRSVVGRGDVPATEPPDRVVAAEEATALREAFRALPSDDQQLLGLRIVARLDARTTGKLLGKRPGAIRMAQARALGRLRVHLAGGEP